ncbi:MAG: SDR family oxidoreductase [Chloroflexia bacterium]|nr:SDR family oxidoreductase [Chloroflexia bacterium]
MDRLDGKGIAITGGAGDIGAAMGAELRRLGAAITLIDRKSPAEAAPWLARAREHGDVAYVQADVRDRDAIEAALVAIDPLDVAIGNAAIGHGIPFLEITPRQWQEHLDVNLTGCFNLGQAAARLMVERDRPGRIIFTGTWVQEVPWPEIAAYSATKAGVRMLARSMARELAPHKILVNVIAPGIVNAGLARHQMETEPQYARRVRHVIPLGVPQTAEQVARATAFLCSDAADYMTGSVLLVDGGLSLFQFAEDGAD